MADDRFVPRPDDPDDVDAVYRPLAAWIAELAGAPRPGALGGENISCEFAPRQHGVSRIKHQPFVVGVAGGIAAGKTTIAELLADLLRQGVDTPEVAVVSADGFLFPNAELAARGLSQRKGFPESYDTAALYAALASLKDGRSALIPRYSHLSYDVAPGVELHAPDVVVIEGVIVLQPPPDGAAPEVSGLIDLGLYIDAAESDLQRWYAERLAELFTAARHEPTSFFHQWSSWDGAEISRFAGEIWEGINRENLRNHIAPSRRRADVVVEKAADHRVSRVLVRRP